MLDLEDLHANFKSAPVDPTHLMATVTRLGATALDVAFVTTPLVNAAASLDFMAPSAKCKLLSTKLSLSLLTVFSTLSPFSEL